MKLYDGIIRQTLDTLQNKSVQKTPYRPELAWKDLGSSELVMLRDAAFELGGDGQPSVNYTCVTTDDTFVPDDAVLVYGPELSAVKGDVSFARITLLETDDLGEDEEAAYNTIRDLEFVRYHVFPEGYMVRVSSESNQEQVRVAKTAIRKGISLARVGCAYIRKYRELPGVRHVRVLFLTAQEEIAALRGNAKKVDDITKTLTHILDGLPTDCGHCSLKPVCDEVEGMREMHMAQKKKERI